MAAPTTEEIRALLEGYNITESVLSNTWIEKRRDNNVVPFVKRLTGLSFSGVTEKEEFLSGTNTHTLMLSSSNASELVRVEYVQGGDIGSEIGLGGLVLIEGGIIRIVSNVYQGNVTSLFRKGKRNIKVTYKVGFADYPEDIKEAIKCLCSEQILGFVGARTGGGSLSVESYSRNYGSRGKYQDVRNDFKRTAMSLLQPYMTHVVGSI